MSSETQKKEFLTTNFINYTKKFMKFVKFVVKILHRRQTLIGRNRTLNYQFNPRFLSKGTMEGSLPLNFRY
jgi:hypothetical protein